MSEPANEIRQPPFWTLVGPDFAGKSTVLRRLKEEYGWHVISHDAPHLAEHPLIDQLVRTWVESAFSFSGGKYTPELVVSLVHPVMLHLRDEVERWRGKAPVIMDSYYYKMLAKNRLLGVEDRAIFDAWRAFPQPHRALYLDIPPELAWLRTGEDGAELNIFEYYEADTKKAGFLRLQAELRKVLLDELDDVPITFIDGTASSEDVFSQVLSALESVDVR
jgi:thymidylate kinase